MAVNIPWVLIAQSDLENYLVPEQRELIYDANAEGNDPFGGVSPDVIAEVRTAIASNPGNQLSAVALKVPPELKRTTIMLIVEALAPWFGNAAPMTPLQTKQIENARKILDRVANWKLESSLNDGGGGFYISVPDDAEVSAQSARPTAKLVDSVGLEVTRERFFTRETLSGL